jgi:hypothetical protein
MNASPLATAAQTTGQLPLCTTSNPTASAACGFQGVMFRLPMGWSSLIQARNR